MWSRKELKARGKAAFKANYWKCVVVALIFALFLGGGVSAGKNRVQNVDDANQQTTLIEELCNAPKEVAVVITGALVGVSVIATLVKLLVVNPLKVGCNRFFLVNSDRPAELSELGFGFKNGYGHMVAAMFLRDLFIALGCILLVIPGIIMTYSYRMVPYILSENPELSGMDAIRRSKEMMRGHKWNAFVLDLSFFGWALLVVLTADIVGVLWVNPYIQATDAELYKAIR